MRKGVRIKEAMVYRPTKLYSEIDKALRKEVNGGQHRSFNNAVNHHLQRSLKVTIPVFFTIGQLSIGDEFMFTSSKSYKIYKVKEACKRNKKLKGVVRRCEIIETGKNVYPRCDKEVIKIN